MKKFFIILVLVFMIASVSAYTKTYDSENEIISIKNNAGTPLLNIQLIENTYFCVVDCHAILKFDILKDGLNNPFSPLKIRKKLGGVWSSGNLDSLTYQHNTTTGIWRSFTRNQFNNGLSKKGTYYVKIVGKKKPTETVDWIPNMFGSLDLNEWALWDSNGIVAYYDFDASSGTVVDEIVRHSKNATTGNMDNTNWVTGIQGNALFFDGVNEFVNITDSTTLMNNALSTISFWIYPQTNYTTTQYFWDGEGANRNYHLMQGAVASWDFRQGGSTPTFTNVGEQIIGDVIGSWFTLNEWHNIVIVYNSSGNNTFWADGVLRVNSTSSWTPADTSSMLLGRRFNGANFYHGRIDELGIWNKTLTSSEISQLYQNGGGVAFGEELTVTLNAPAAGSQIFTQTLTTFNVTGQDVNSDLINATLFFDSVENETKSLTGTTNTTTFDKILSVGSHTWKVEICNNISICQTSETRSFEITSVIYNSFNSSNLTIETSQETLTTNLSINSSKWSAVNVKLFYNGTFFTATTSDTGDARQYTAQANIPLVSTNATNLSYLWSTTLTNSSGSFNFNSSSNNQTVETLVFALCNATHTVPYLNFSFQNEADLTSINATIPSSTFTYYLGTGTINRTLSFTNNTANDYYSFCSTPSNTQLKVDPLVQYASTGFPQRVYDPNVLTVNNTNTNQTLYLLATADGQFVTFQVINLAQQAISGVGVNVTRLVSGNTVLVGQGTTDAAGSVTFFLNPDFAHILTFTKSGLDTTVFSVTPSQTSYTVTMGGDSVLSDDFSQGITFSTTPSGDFLDNNTVHNFTLTLVSTFWTVDSFTFSLFWDNGTLITIQSSSANGGVLSFNNLNMSLALGQKAIYMDYSYTINSTTINKQRTWIIQSTDGRAYSIWNFITNSITHMDNGIFGFDEFGKTLLSVLIIIVVAGGIGKRYGIRSDAFVTGMIFSMVLLLDYGLGFIPAISFGGRTAIENLPSMIMFLVVVIVLIMEERR